METTTTGNIAPASPGPTTARDASCCPPHALAPGRDEPVSVALAGRLKALADETRLRMLDLLVQHGEPLCVCEITEQFDLSQSTISHHLRLLREAGLIDGERRGTWMYYALTADGKRCMSLVTSLV